MTQVGEGVAVTTIKETKPGTLRVQVRDSIDNKLIPGAEVSIGSKKLVTDDSGEVTFDNIPSGAAGVQVKKHFEEADYIKFITHYPKFVRKYEAKSIALEGAIIKPDATSKLRVYIDNYQVVKSVSFRRAHIKTNPNLDYGHWWVLVGEDNSYGWWPEPGHLQAKEMERPIEPIKPASDASWKDKVNYIAKKSTYAIEIKRYESNNSKFSNYGQAIVKTFAGVPGVLNGGGDYLKEERDPHHDDRDYEEEYTPVFKPPKDTGIIHKSIRDFSLSYSGGWSWRFEMGENCHTFQKEMIKHLKFSMFKEVK